MSKYCKSMGLYVTYLDCMECETKECVQSHSKEVNKMKKVYLSVEPEQIVYLVYASKREGHESDIVIKCKCESITIYPDKVYYSFKPIKVVTKSKQPLNSFVSSFMCENANINTGKRDGFNRYPVFTNKEDCIKWLRM